MKKDGIEVERDESIESLKQWPAMAGIGLSMGVVLSAVFALKPNPLSAGGVDELWLRLICLFVVVSLLFGLRFAADELYSMRKSGWIRILLCISGIALFASYFVGEQVQLPHAVFLVAWMVFGLYIILCLVVWSEFFDRISLRHAMPMLVMSSLVGGGLLLFFDNADALIGDLALMAAVLLMLCLNVFYDGERGFPRRKKAEATPSTIFSLCLGSAFVLSCSGFVCGALIASIFSGKGPLPPGQVVSISLLAACFILILRIVITRRRSLSLSSIMRVSYPVYCACLLAMPVLTGWWFALCQIAMLALFFASDIVNWAMHVAHISRYKVQPLPQLLRGKSHFSLGVLLGWAGAYAAALLPVAALTQYGISCICIVLLAISVSVSPFERDAYSIKFLPKESGKRNVRPGSAPVEIELTDELWAKACEFVSDRAQLTAREREVFYLLSKGRNASVVERELTISASTAKTHIYRIYQKVGVASHQELIDTVEASVESVLE